MGRDLSWYIIPKTLAHDSSKPVCLHLEFEPEKDDKGDLLYTHFYPEDGSHDKKRQTLCQDLEYTHIEDTNAEWCSLSHLYMNGGLYFSKLVLEKYDVQHKYSNPIWNSDWNIKGFYMGSSTTPFLRKFNQNHHMYREINAYDIANVVKHLERLGDPVRTSDKMALEETMEVLRFLKKWVERDDVRMVMQDEL